MYFLVSYQVIEAYKAGVRLLENESKAIAVINEPVADFVRRSLRQYNQLKTSEALDHGRARKITTIYSVIPITPDQADALADVL